MTTPPRITSVEADAAIERITHRHQQADDPHAEMIGTDPRDVLDYLGKHRSRSRDLPDWARRADIADAITLHVWLWWDDRRRELATLRAGREHHVTLTQLGMPLGIRTAQGTQDRIDRLTALLRDDRPDEKLSREARRLAAQGTRDIRHDWIADHATELRAIARDLLAAAERYEVDGDAREWLDELAADLDVDRITPATMAVLGLATAEVRTCPTVAALDTPHGVHQVIAAADQLRAAYARAT